MDLRTRLNLFNKVTIYPVSCEELSAGRTDLDILKAVIDGGAHIIQLRDKRSDRETLLEKAIQFRKICTEAGILLIINDHLDIALECGADGVHLGQDDQGIREAREKAPELLIGASTHNETEVLAAEKAGASYINIGPVYATGTKENVHPALGTATVRKLSALTSLPFTVMGGIKRENIAEVLKTGARHIAVVTALTQAPDITAETDWFHSKICNSLT